VFMDQYVLTTSGGLDAQLSDNLSTSATGVIIWSHNSEDSEWCKTELTAFRDLERSKPKFRYVVVNVDGADLPPFAKQKLWLDFSPTREGPSGTNLLRLLFGLQGKPLPAEGVILAAEVDEANRRALARINALQDSGDAEGLVDIAGSKGIEWQTSSVLGSKTAEALIALKKNDEAIALIDKLTALFPRSIRPQQLRGLALARKGDWRLAQQTLLELYYLGEHDPETLGILARTWRDRYAQSGDLLHLRKARDLYAEAFNSAPSDYYTGINAAANSVLLGETEVADQYAEKVEKIVGTAAKPSDYWATATVAEVQLIRRNYPVAAKLYESAVTMDTEAKANHESTLGQARRLMGKLQPSQEERNMIEKAFGIQI
jgi:tetratricopeptide (TPR) repeat protein